MKLEDMILISVDDHLIEPPDLFEKHLPASLKDKAPKVVSKDGADSWIYEGREMPNVALNAVVGRPPEEYGFEPVGYNQIRKGTWSLKEHLDDMNVDGVLARLCFPTMALFAGTAFLGSTDDKAAYAMVQAYNDWQFDDWCAGAPGRFIMNGILPLWDIDLCVTEAKRLAAKGCHSISFPDLPPSLKLPSIHTGHWDPLFQVMEDNQMVVSCHIGSGGQAPHASMDSPIDVWITTMPISIHVAAADWMFSPVFKKFPNLMISLAEGGVGWIPYLLERAEFVYRHHLAWTNSDKNFANGMSPSEVFHKHFITCFIEDKFAMQNTGYLNLDNVCWECDYPHSDCVWPYSPETIWQSIKHLPKQSIDKVTHQNAMRHYSFDPISILGRENCTVGALRKQAAHVDTTPKAGQGGLNPNAGKDGPVTSADIVAIFTKAAAAE
jgi:predicted TIM-barrel fold metal-dependent hydrolase